MEYAILGIQQPETEPEGSPATVARVRMFLNGGAVDEDFTLPELPEGTPPTEQIYSAFLKDTINGRMTELGASNE